ncbi:unnamed protein product, partial [marine sediment metagenome]
MHNAIFPGYVEQSRFITTNVYALEVDQIGCDLGDTSAE